MCQQNDADEELLAVVHNMYVNGDTAKKQELEESYKRARRRRAQGPY